jgi:DNA-binding Lrp family transcriptional regulator
VRSYNKGRKSGVPEKRKKRRRPVMVTAFVLITVPSKRSGAVLEELRKRPEVREAAAVYGETDLIAKLQVPTMQDLELLIMDAIQGNPDVKSTRTYVAIEKLHWER